jgi:hypothetical protein
MAAAAAQGRMGGATIASVAIHVAVALAIPALAWTASSAPAIETVSFTHILHIQVVPPRAPAPPPRAVAPRVNVKPTINFANHVPVIAAIPRRHASPTPVVASNAPAAPAAGAIQRAGTGTTDSNAAPNVTPSPAAREVASIGQHRVGGYLPFGAEQPNPVLDPGVRKQLDALGTHVTVLVMVGEDGRTESVYFDPPIDPQIENRIRTLLADASWDPAVCGGGVACEGRATIKL